MARSQQISYVAFHSIESPLNISSPPSMPEEECVSFQLGRRTLYARRGQNSLESDGRSCGLRGSASVRELILGPLRFGVLIDNNERRRLTRFYRIARIVSVGHVIVQIKGAHFSHGLRVRYDPESSLRQ